MSAATLKLLPMLCALYTEQQSWSSTQCMEQIVDLLHILYAYWPQIEVIILQNFISLISYVII
jgi:hypothetical protein